ncbi:UNVERIFIED_CONTAM: putative disease resistance protein [Sesamum radiatum]|uniref:Disease resistance protein n=1 Tax=Sesamum radiatum TaxID=300843 RepID=A0AAW2NUH1_SESRA
MEVPREPPVLLESKPLEMAEEFESRRLMEENIIAALKDENINTIGICGFGGIGKTRMARRIGEKVKSEKLFKFVVMVRVGRNYDPERIVYEISDYLGVKVEVGNFMATVNKLRHRLLVEERILIILDNVWEILDLEKLRVPLHKHKGSCKILITSRLEDVCLAMGANAIFAVQGLTEEEAWSLLRERVGVSVDSSDLYPLARSVAQKCKGLPFALNAIGRYLKDIKLCLGFVAENNVNPTLSYESKLLQEMDAWGSSFGEGIETNINLIRKMSLNVSLPPKRGQIISNLLKNLIPLVEKVPLSNYKTNQHGAVITMNVHDLLHELPLKLAASDLKASAFQLLSLKKLKYLRGFGAVNWEANHDTLLDHGMDLALESLVALDLSNTGIRVLPRKIKRMVNLKLLVLTNCHNLQYIEPGLISSFDRLEELYMLGSFSGWEVEKEGKRVGNASINELELLPNLTALQIQIQDQNIIAQNSKIWSRSTVYVISTPEELKCRFQESSHLSFPAVHLDDYYREFLGAMDFFLPNLTPLVDWLCVMLRSTESLRLAGVGSKNAVDELIPEGFKLLKQLEICNCSTMEYLVNGADQVLQTNGLFPVLESLCLKDLPLFIELFHGQFPVAMFGKLRNLKLLKLPSLVHVFRNPTQSVSVSNLRSVHISHCPKLQSLFSLSTAQSLVQLEEIKIENCEIMEEIFSEERPEGGNISCNKIEFAKLNYIELDTLPNLTGFCKSVRIDFPQLTELCIQSLRKLRTLCPNESELLFRGNDDTDDSVMQCLFTEKIAFGSLKKLEIIELDSLTNIWCQQPTTSWFSELEVLVVMSCDTLRNLFSYSIAKVLVQLKHMTVEECVMMQEVIAEDCETGQPEINESLFPQLKVLELRRLPLLESFCHMIKGLELPSLEDVTLYNCPRMKEFSGGRSSMPMLKCVKRDHSIYRIDGIIYTVEHLFSEKHLFVHQSWPSHKQYQGTEDEFKEEEIMKGSIHSHPELSSQATRGNTGASFQHDEDQKEKKRRDKDVSAGHSYVGAKEDEGKGEEVRREAKLEVSIDVVSHNEKYLKDFILFCSIFPSDYKFTKDMLVWQWIAEGLINLGEDEIMEGESIRCFDTLLNLGYIMPAGYNHRVDQMKYRVGEKVNAFIQKQQYLEPKFQKYLDTEEITDVLKVEHLSLAFKEIDCINFGTIKQCGHLKMLSIHRCYGSKMKNLIPSDLFLELQALKILNLSHIDIMGLPSSVENLKELQCLDMCATPILGLPESMKCLSNLRTLNLDGCLSLMTLPKCTSMLINLRHLVLDVVGQLQSMPAGIGKLSKLRTLRAFLAGEDEGSRIGELKDMNKLKGSLLISHLENVSTKEEAAEACLCNKQDLKKIELQWSDLQDNKNPDEEEILESLQPPLGIQELKIFYYSGGVLPSWISNPSFTEVVSITLYRCRYCDTLPPFGELPALKFLTILEMNEVLEINRFFCRRNQITNQHHHVAFPKLEKLSFDSMAKLENWTGVENGDFPYLRHLIIAHCGELVALPFLSHLNSLLHVEIINCPRLSCLPEGGLPPTLELLMIKDCPKLKERCSNDQCDDWPKVAHIPAFYIDHQKVSV